MGQESAAAGRCPLCGRAGFAWREALGRLLLWAGRVVGGRDGAALLLVAWVANFFWMSRFGLYEDDWFVIGVPWSEWNLSIFWTVLRAETLTMAGTYGRPLTFAISHTLSFFLCRLGGGPFLAYAAAFLLLAANVRLLHALALRLAPRPAAVLAALLFALWPPDTTRPWVHVAFSVQSALLFLLLGAHAWLSRRAALCWLMALLALLTYEACALPFLGLPLLTAPWDRRWLARAALNAAVVAGLVAGSLALRAGASDARAGDMLGDRRAAAAKAADNAWRGPWAAAKAAVERPLFALRKLADRAHFNDAGVRRRDLAFALLLGVAGLAYVLARALRADGADGPGGQAAVARLFLGGLALASLAYAPLVIRDVEVVEGRMSSAHTPGSVGGSLAAAALLYAGWAALRAVRLAALAPVALGAYLSVLLGYGLATQAAYARAAVDQAAFWRTVLAQCPDLDDGTIVIFPSVYRQPGELVEGVTIWPTYLIPRLLVEFPPHWKQPPRVYSLHGGPVDKLEWHFHAEGGALYFDHVFASFAGPQGPLPPGNVILFEEVGGRLVRRTGTVEIKGVKLALKEAGPDVLSRLGKRRAYHWLMSVPVPPERLPDAARLRMPVAAAGQAP
jgi:hypothetical protein